MARFFQRPYPNANAILLDGDVLVDPGAREDVPAILDWLGGVRPALIVNTHWHTDHSGANAAFQARGVPVALPAPEAARIAAHDPDACRAHWLHQPHDPFRADRGLAPGEAVAGWTVVPLPGHSPTQIGLVHNGVLLSADALMDRDIGWLDQVADPHALERAQATIDWIAAAGIHTALPGHGPAVHDVPAALARARQRLASWRADPARIGWHAAKRILTHALIVTGGIEDSAMAAYLAACPWAHDIARHSFGQSLEAFGPRLVDDMLRSGAARREHGQLVAAVDYVSSPRR